MQKKLVVANWKMLLTHQESIELGKNYVETFADIIDQTNVELVVCPTFTALYQLKNLFLSSGIQLGAQTSSDHLQGAFTGEVSPIALQELGCTYCLVGHAERRIWYHETIDIIVHKMALLHQCGIKPVVCIGEFVKNLTIEKIMETLYEQLKPLLCLASQLNASELIIAYEPQWTIGTEQFLQAEYLKPILNNIRAYVQHICPEIALLILYGGNVTKTTIKELEELEYLNGFLVGRASVDFQEFKKIVY